jgi:WD40 repeat protein
LHGPLNGGWTGAPIGKPMQHQDRVWTASFDPKGERVVTASDDRTARIWDAAAARQPSLDQLRSMLGPRAEPLKTPAALDRSQGYADDFAKGIRIIWTRLLAAFS